MHPHEHARDMLRAALLLAALALSACCPPEARFFRPEIRDFPTPPDVEQLYFSAADGKRIHAWLVQPAGVRPDGDRPLIVFCHGNATQIDGILPQLRPLIDQTSATWLLLSYRGYGKSDDVGCVTRKSIVQDANAAIDKAKTLDGVDPGAIAIMGYSAGGVPALAGAADHPEVRAVVVGGTYDTADNALRAMGRGGLTWLISSAYDPAKSITELDGRPVFIFHGTADHSIGHDAAERLAAVGEGAGADVTLYLAEGAGHNTILTDDPDLIPRIAEFLNAHLE